MCILFYFRYANDVSIGDVLLVQDNKNLVPAKVVDVTDLTMQGNYSNYFHSFWFPTIDTEVYFLTDLSPWDP